MDNHPPYSSEPPKDDFSMREQHEHTPAPQEHSHGFSLHSVFNASNSDHGDSVPTKYDALEVSTITPQAVVKVLSPRGVEYVFLTIALFTGAISIIDILIIFVNGSINFGLLAFPTAALFVTLPVFTALFLRLKRAELTNPKLALDPSKRRSTQFTKIVTFIVCFFTLIGLMYGIFAKAGGIYKGSLVKLILDALVILVIAGGILVYYWANEHTA
jgi:hypothetical protein